MGCSVTFAKLGRWTKTSFEKKKKTGFDIHFKDRAQNKIFETYPLDTWKTITEKTISFKKVQIWMIFLSSKLKIGKRIKAWMNVFGAVSEMSRLHYNGYWTVMTKVVETPPWRAEEHLHEHMGIRGWKVVLLSSLRDWEKSYSYSHTPRRGH